MKQTLQDIINAYHDIEEEIIAAEGEVTEEIEQRINALLGDDFSDKMDGYTSLINHMKSEITFLETEAESLVSRKKTMEKSIENMRNRMVFALQNIGMDKLKTTKHSYSIRTTSSWSLTDTAKNDDKLLSTLAQSGMAKAVYKPDIKAIRERYTDTPPDFITVKTKESISIR